MSPVGWLVVLLVQLGPVAGAPRSADGSLLEAVQRELSEMGHEAPYRLSPAHKVHRSHHSHRVRHRPRGTLASAAETRCYCSLPACVTTGFMCQSMVGSCFSETVEMDRHVHTRHGCLELLSRHKQRICERLHSENKADLRLRCCTEDMCNIVNDAAISVDFDRRLSRVRDNSGVQPPTPPAQLQDTVAGRYQTQQQQQQRQEQQQQQQRSGELWLRAATIAVPIAGLFILAGLVLLAVRMLRRESKPPYHYAKAPLCLEPTPSRAPADAAAGVGTAPAAHHAAVPVHCVLAAADWRCDT